MVIDLFERYYPGRPHSTKHQACVDKFAEMLPAYNKIRNHARSLPNVATPETFVFWNYKDSSALIDKHGYEPRFLVNWIGARGYSKPSWINPIESIHHQGKKDKGPIFDGTQIMIDGWFNTKMCKAMKLVAVTEAYAHVSTKNRDRKIEGLSSGEIKEYLLNHYDIVDKNGDLMELEKAGVFAKRLSEIGTHKQTGGALKKRSPKKS
jgi:hypothetical protein